MRIVYGICSNFFGEYACFIDPKFVVDLSTVDFAVKKALKNWNIGKRISKSLAVEILLYFSATRQIETAKKLTARDRAVTVVIDEQEFSKIDFRELKFVPEYDLRAVMELYEISEEEIKIVGEEKLPLLVKERIALFSLLGD
ncbi:MAG: KEOPS complex subunit Cgi121 [Archaeoglobaceae archaeon]|nr:KEOPS complex subunit Cgi121 [Archaeoglobaceae archaeon]